MVEHYIKLCATFSLRMPQKNEVKSSAHNCKWVVVSSAGILLSCDNIWNTLLLTTACSAFRFNSLEGHTHTQKKLSDAIEEVHFNSILNSCSLADKTRLLSVSSLHASAWISDVPSLSLGLHLDPSEFQPAVKWWLGVNHSLSLDGNPMVCPLCPNCAFDPLGYHCVT